MRRLLFALLMCAVMVVPCYAVETISLVQLANFPEDYVGKTVAVKNAWVTVDPLFFSSLEDGENFGISLHSEKPVEFTTNQHKYNRRRLLTYISKKQAKQLVANLNPSMLYPLQLTLKIKKYEDGDGFNARITSFVLNGETVDY